MKITNPERKLITDVVESQRLKIDSQQSSKVANLLIEELYSNPIEAAIREAVANAIDATSENKETDKLSEVYLKGKRVYIRDYGHGLTREELEGRYLKLGESTKTDTNELVGGFGIGRLALLNLCGRFIIQSYRDNVCHLYIVRKRDDSIELKYIKTYDAPDEPTGVMISSSLRGLCYAHSEQLKKQIDFAKIGGRIQTEPELLDQHHYLQGTNWRLYSTQKFTEGSILINFGGIIYRLQEFYPFFTHKSDSRADLHFQVHSRMGMGQIHAYELNETFLLIDIPIGEIPLSSSRERCITSSESYQYLRDRIDSAYAEIEKIVSDAVATEKNIQDALRVVESVNYPLEVNWKGIKLINGCIKYFVPFEVMRENPKSVGTLISHGELCSTKHKGYTLFWSRELDIYHNTMGPFYRTTDLLNYPIVFDGNPDNRASNKQIEACFPQLKGKKYISLRLDPYSNNTKLIYKWLNGLEPVIYLYSTKESKPKKESKSVRKVLRAPFPFYSKNDWVKVPIEHIGNTIIIDPSVVDKDFSAYKDSLDLNKLRELVDVEYVISTGVKGRIPQDMMTQRLENLLFVNTTEFVDEYVELIELFESCPNLIHSYNLKVYKRARVTYSNELNYLKEIYPNLWKQRTGVLNLRDCLKDIPSLVVVRSALAGDNISNACLSEVREYMRFLQSQGINRL